MSLSSIVASFFQKISGRDRVSEKANSIDELYKKMPQKNVITDMDRRYVDEMGLAVFDGITPSIFSGKGFSLDISELDEADRFILSVIDYSQFFTAPLTLLNIKREVVLGKVVRYKISSQEKNNGNYDVLVEVPSGEPEKDKKIKVFFENDRFSLDDEAGWKMFLSDIGRARIPYSEFERDVSNNEVEDNDEVFEDRFEKKTTDFLKDYDINGKDIESVRVVGDYDFDAKDMTSNFKDFEIDREVEFKADIVVTNKRDGSIEHKLSEMVRFVIFDNGSFVSVYFGYELPITALSFK